MQLVLRLAAGQGIEQIALLFRLSLWHLALRVRQVQGLACGMQALHRLPVTARFNRLARLAHLLLGAAMREGRPGARDFFHWSWSHNEDPAQRIAALAEAVLQRIGKVGDGLPLRPARPRTRRIPSPSPRARLTLAAVRFALALRDDVLLVEGQALEAGLQLPREMPARRADPGRPFVPAVPWWVTAFAHSPEAAPCWAPLRLPEGIPGPPPQGIPSHGRAIWIPLR
jgi:hypothetical protein